MLTTENRFDFVKTLGHIEKYRITDLAMVPPIAVLFAKHPAVKTSDLSSIAYLASGAAPLGREVCAEVEQLFPDGRVNVKQVSLRNVEASHAIVADL